jgi:quinol monooxygenase YgiN
MTNQTIHVVARFVAIPNKVEELKAILLGLIEPTRLEAGVIKYELLQNQSEPTDFTFVEEWESAAALDTHLASPHLQAAIAKLEGLIAAPLEDIRRYSILAAIPTIQGVES